MAVRKSKYSEERKGKCGRPAFSPNFDDWKRACETYIYDRQIYEHFGISCETFYAFKDRERFKQETEGKSEFLEFYIKGRNKQREWALNNLKNLADNGNEAAVIYSAKTFGGLLEAKDIAHIELKKKEVENKINLEREKFEYLKNSGKKVEELSENIFEDVT